MRIKITTESLDTLSREGLALGFFTDERPPRGHCGFVDWRLNGIISRELARGHISAAFMEKVIISSSPRIPASKILLLGMGLLAELTDDKLYQAGYHLSETMDGILCHDFAFSLPGAGRCHLPVSAITESIIRGCFDFLSKDIEKWATSSTTILAGESYLEDVVSGLNNFSIKARDISIIDIEGSPEMTIF
ncbi:MAG TPA: M17 family peptidase N-terminal domain-containing protein [Syntrophales bacterium]|nr:M17 family peptidase N-terminal domain-containing protein [Syntrophales bacterium]